MRNELKEYLKREFNLSDEDYQKLVDNEKARINQPPTFEYNGIDLDESKTMKIKELSYKCRQDIIGGFASSSLGVEHTYPSDEEAQRNLQGSIVDSIIDDTVTNVNFKTIDSGYLDHTVEEIKQVGKDWKTHLESNLYRYNQMKAQVKECTTISDVEEFIW